MTNPEPVNLIAEEAFIGAMLIDPSNIAQATLDPSELHDRELGAIWAKMRILDRAGRQIDVVTIAGKSAPLTSRVLSLLSLVPNSQNWHEYQREVLHSAYCRRLLQTASELAKEAYSGTPDQGKVSGLLDKLTRDAPGSLALKGIGQINGELIDIIEERTKNPQPVWGIPTGFLDLDEILGGWQKKQVCIIAGEPGIGKSRVLLQSMSHAAKLGRAGLLFSAEMSDDEIGTRFLSVEAEVRTRSIESGKLSGEDWESLYQTLANLDGCPLYVCDLPNPTLEQIQTGIIDLRRRGVNVEIVGVDYIWLVAQAIKTRNMNDDDATNSVVAGLKRIAKIEDVAILAISSVNKAGMDTGGKDTKMGNLRGGGQQIHDAHNVIFLSQADNNPQVIIGQFMKGRHLRVRRLEFVLLNDPNGTPKLLTGASRKQKLDF